MLCFKEAHQEVAAVLQVHQTRVHPNHRGLRERKKMYKKMRMMKRHPKSTFMSNPGKKKLAFGLKDPMDYLSVSIQILSKTLASIFE
jgi:hypothetical protein